MLTKEGVEALLLVKAQKLKQPESLDMGAWIECNPCGTVSCIAGQIVINKFASNGDINLRHLEQESLRKLGGYANAAGNILGFSKGQWETYFELFHKRHWPEKFYYAYVEEKAGSKERAEILGQMIDWFIETNYKPEEVIENA
jgi:hypothetical protein